MVLGQRLPESRVAGNSGGACRAPPSASRRPSRATAPAPRYRRSRRSRRTRCAGPAARRDRRRCRRRRLPSRAAPTRPLAKAACAVGVERRDVRSTIVRQTEVFERVAGSTARWPSQRDPLDEAGRAPRHWRRRARSAPSSPPIDFAHSQRVEIVLDAEHRRRVDRLALEDALDQLAALGQAEDLRQRPGRRVALQPLDRARARGSARRARPRRPAPSARRR